MSDKDQLQEPETSPAMISIIAPFDIPFLGHQN